MIKRFNNHFIFPLSVIVFLILWASLHLSQFGNEWLLTKTLICFCMIFCILYLNTGADKKG